MVLGGRPPGRVARSHVIFFYIMPLSDKNHLKGIFYVQGKNIKLCFTSYNENDCFLMASPIINIK